MWHCSDLQEECVAFSCTGSHKLPWTNQPTQPAKTVACKPGAHSPNGRLETGPSLQKRIAVCGVVAIAAAHLKSLIKGVRIVSTGQADGVER